MGRDIHPDPGRPFQKHMPCLVEADHQRPLAPAEGGVDIPERDGRLPAPRGADQQGARATVEPAAEQGIKLPDAARDWLLLEAAVMLGRDQTRKDVNAAT